MLNTFDVSGRGRFAGISYEHVLPRWNGVHHRVTVALDDKLFDNQIVAFGANLGVDARSRPVTLGYSGEYAGDGWSTTFRASYSRNTMSGGGNKGAAYRANRAGADTHWDVFRGGLTFDVLLPAEWALRAIFDGQLANEELIPGEQFGLGGASSVRGFDERQISGDDGVRGSFELWAPPPAGTDLRFLFFVDTGSVKLKRPNPGITSRDALASTGVGVRWQYKDRVAVSLDVGKVLEGTARRDEDARGHLNVLVRY